MKKIYFIFLINFLGLLVCADQDVRVRLTPLSATKYHMHFPLQSGQVIYGPAAKEMGLPLTIRWEKQENIDHVDVTFPPTDPLAFSAGKTTGYTKPFTLEMTVFPQNVTAPFRGQGEVDYLLCDKICAPKTFTFTLPKKGYQPASLFFLLALSLLAGFLLNGMPCILPILAIKVFGVVRASKKERPVLRKNYAFTAGGCLIFFMVFSGVIIGMRHVGMSAGWGMHFQSPYFMCFYLLLLTFLLGRLPFLQEVDAKFNYKGFLKHPSFMALIQGFFLALLATPCTGPFLGLVMGYTLTQPKLLTLLIYLCVGVGFAAPYLLLAIEPRLLQRLLPKPGPWMRVLEKCFTGLFLATIVWGLWVLGQEIGFGLAAVYAGLLSMLYFGIRQYYDKAKYGLILAGALILFLPQLHQEEEVPPLRLTQLQAQVRETQQPMLVNVTAAWCLTCHANQAVLKSQRVRDMLAHHHIQLITIDWTKRDDQVREMIQAFDRDGIPFTFLLTPENLEGIPLPEILTSGSLKEVFAQELRHTSIN